jgi:coenzyme F420-0:L-glutamate ligase/coenzyme F420-1:gamma-L-glutamate ligase
MLTPIDGLPNIGSGDDLAALTIAQLQHSDMALRGGDVLVFAQKVVSKAEGRLVELASVTPSARAREVAAETQKDPRLVELILSEARRVVRSRPGVLIVEHRLGFIVANAGVDQSNVGPSDGVERALLLPRNPDASAAKLRSALEDHFRVPVGVIINDSFGRPWRLGTAGVALGVAGMPALNDLRGTPDLFGRPLMVTTSAFADEIAAAASLVMGQAGEGRPVVLVRGLRWQELSGSGQDLIRPIEEDLFR